MGLFASRLKPSGMQISLFDSIEFVSEELWNGINMDGNLFLGTEYLKALEKAPPKNMEFKYAILREENRPVAIAAFQILSLNAELHDSLMVDRTAGTSSMDGIHSKMKAHLSNKMLVCGNALLCGEHGFAGIPGTDRAKLSRGISEAMERIRRVEMSSGKANILLLKDFYDDGKYNTAAFTNAGYYEYSAGPNMVVPIRETWATFDDYLADMKGKYRSRIVGAMKKGDALIRKSLALEEIEANREGLYRLYLQVADKAKFRLFLLNPGMLAEMKRYLKDRFIVDAYYANETIVAYTTRVFNGTVMEGYSHGLDYESNKEYELYQNILIDDIREAIRHRMKKINFGRTSVAMKSSLGAVPEEAEFFMQCRLLIPNPVIKKVSYHFKPQAEHCRNPFT